VVDRQPEAVAVVTEEKQMSSKKNINSLAALAAAAASLPVYGEAMPTEKVFAYRASQYQEDDTPRERTITPEAGRYSIDIHQLRYARPLAGDWYLNGEFQYETMSGASPIQTYETPDGKSAIVMSGASIDETRYDLKLAPKKYISGAYNGQIDGTLGGMLALSVENDYRSVALGGDGSLELFDKHTTLFASISTSLDALSPTDTWRSGDRQKADGRSKRSVSLYEGLSQVIDKNRVLKTGIGYTRLTGYLSDPYKRGDTRPGQRDQFTLDAQYRHFISVGAGAAAQGDYRYYSDNWGVRSHTFTVRWAQMFNMSPFSLRIIPMARYYRQTSADFYSLQQPSDDSEYSSDYRLASYGAFSYGTELKAIYRSWTVSLDWQQYYSSENFAIVQSSNEETPALVDYTVLSFGIEYRH